HRRSAVENEVLCQLHVFIDHVERSEIDAQPAIEKIALHTQLYGIDRFRVIRSDGLWGIDATDKAPGLEPTGIVAIEQNILAETIVEPQFPAELIPAFVFGYF